MPGLPDAASRAGLAPLDYMRRFGAFLIEGQVGELQKQAVSVPADAVKDDVTGVVSTGGKPIGVEIDGKVVTGFPTPSRKLGSIAAR